MTFLVDAFSEKPEHHFDPLGSGFEEVQRRAEARGEDFAASLTLEARDAFVMTVANEGVGTDFLRPRELLVCQLGMTARSHGARQAAISAV